MDKEIKIIGKSHSIKKLLEFIKKAAKTDLNVLLLGETGVGKELSARAIHRLSDRKNKPLIKVNCANLNENLIESELFGHKKGAYTGAFIDKPGLIEEANEGTFFLDEIADISPHLQAKLLTVIEESELRRLGEVKTRKINVRFIFATNKDLYKLVTKGKVREDFYYRISILSFYILPLRKRKEDIPLLIESILRKESLRQSRNFNISRRAIDKIMTYVFAGNVRELENILKRAALFSENCVIKEENIHLPQKTTNKKTRYKSRFSIEQIINALVKHHGIKSKAAKELGISRRHIYRLLNF